MGGVIDTVAKTAVSSLTGGGIFGALTSGLVGQLFAPDVPSAPSVAPAPVAPVAVEEVDTTQVEAVSAEADKIRAIKRRQTITKPQGLLAQADATVSKKTLLGE